MTKPITFQNIPLTFTPKPFVVECKLRLHIDHPNCVSVFHDTEESAREYVARKNHHYEWVSIVRPCNDNDIAEQCAEYIANVTSQIINKCMSEGGIKLHYKAIDIVCNNMRECIDGNWENQDSSPQSMGWVGHDGRP